MGNPNNMFVTDAGFVTGDAPDAEKKMAQLAIDSANGVTMGSPWRRVTEPGEVPATYVAARAYSLDGATPDDAEPVGLPDVRPLLPDGCDESMFDFQITDETEDVTVDVHDFAGGVAGLYERYAGEFSDDVCSPDFSATSVCVGYAGPDGLIDAVYQYAFGDPLPPHEGTPHLLYVGLVTYGDDYDG